MSCNFSLWNEIGLRPRRKRIQRCSNMFINKLIYYNNLLALSARSLKINELLN